MRDLLCPVVLLMVMHLVVALPVATVRVQFSSPPHSYSHGHDVHSGTSETASQTAQPLAYHLRSLPLAPSAVSSDFLGYPPARTSYREFPRGRSLEVAPLLENEEQSIVQDVEPTGAELESLIARFADNAPRFFPDFPHQRALLSNIQLRLSQHLSDLRLGSIRPGSPFLRA